MSVASSWRCPCSGCSKAAKKERQNIIQMIKQRHDNGSIGGTEWTNHHGLDRCDCDELIEWLEGIK
jgi:hypothetical protein